MQNILSFDMFLNPQEKNFQQFYLIVKAIETFFNEWLIVTNNFFF